MKKLLSFALFSASALVVFHATAQTIPTDTPYGPITIDWTLSQSNQVRVPKYPGGGLTNVTGKGASKSTNVVQDFKYSITTTTKFGDTAFLDLLEGSLGVSFPAGSKLAISGSQIYVVDKTGTNEVADITPVLTVTTYDTARSGLTSTTTNFKAGETITTSVANGTARTEVVALDYNDSALVKVNPTQFVFVGANSVTASQTVTLTETNNTITDKLKGSEVFKITGVGHGTIRGVGTVISGTISGSPAVNTTIFIP